MMFTMPDEPPLPPGYLENTMAMARKARSRDRRVQLVMATLAVLVFGSFGAVVPGRMVGGPGIVPAGPVLPDRIEGYRPLTAEVSRSAGGPAVMVFQSGSFETFYSYQALALGMDGRTYRDVDALRNSDGKHHRRGLLSPDGTAMLVAEDNVATAVLRYVDLASGASREIKLPEPAGVMLYAWSPDGQYVAYGQTLWRGTEASNALELQIYRVGTLSILDLRTGEVRSLAELGPVAAASFAPGSQQLALQAGDKLTVIDVDGTRPREIRLPATGLGLAPGVAWSPDGRLIALIPWDAQQGPEIGPWNIRGPRKVTFVDSTGAGSRTTPEPVVAQHLLGWRGPRSIAELDFASLEVTEISLDTGERRILSTFERPHTCELWTHECGLAEVTVASGLLTSVQVRPAEPPLRGPWPRWLELSAALLGALAGLAGYLIIRRVRQPRA